MNLETIKLFLCEKFIKSYNEAWFYEIGSVSTPRSSSGSYSQAEIALAPSEIALAPSEIAPVSSVDLGKTVR